MSLQTEFEFVLPRGYVDEQGQVHRVGRMRIATVRDEIGPLNDPRVRANEAYLVVILLAQVITSLGELDRVDVGVIENMFATDLAYLQDLYQRVNQMVGNRYIISCPHCGQGFEQEIPLAGATDMAGRS